MDREGWTQLEPQDDRQQQAPKSTRSNQIWRKGLMVTAVCIVLYGSYSVLANRVVQLSAARYAAILPGHHDCSPTTTSVPQYFQTSPGAYPPNIVNRCINSDSGLLELWAGPTATGRAPFLAQTNPVSFDATATFAPSNPLETAAPILGQGQNQSIFQLMGNLSPYFSNPHGFGVAEYPLPPGAKLSQLQVILLLTAIRFH